MDAFPDIKIWNWYKNNDQNILSAMKNLSMPAEKQASYKCIAKNEIGIKETSIEIIAKCMVC